MKGVALLGGGMPVVLWVRVQGQSVIVRVSDWEVVSRVFERDLREREGSLQQLRCRSCCSGRLRLRMGSRWCTS